MKSPLRLVLLVTGGLGVGASAATAIAQTPPAPPAPPAASQAQPTEQASPPFDIPGGGRMFERTSRFSPEDRAAFFDARVAAIHAGLRLTPDQEKLWPALEGAARDAMKIMTDERQKFRAAGPATNPVDRLQRAAELLTVRGQSLKKIADAAQPFYGSLTDEQKHRLPVLMHAGRGGRERVGMWMHRHGGGRGGEDSGPGWRQGRMGPDDGMRDSGRGGRGWDRD